ncbi:class I SAM-dependent methyltransferase [Actinospica sp.]|jgi:SAM-dependent methyltransferase|uniref:class I SAM-dependent methyltransferase n=1 Tax=Actinospica sp. TaxID=1872142 RepID=UPI002B74A652|nr:class I SAM-dependent methyltransferase [Actinospica sp.]HWG23583.1 class I SAM-dependent methyltransferase [Actinospica sp.]
MGRQQDPTSEDAPRSDRKRHRVFASWYPGRAAAMDRGGFAAYRDRFLAGLSGQVLEIGAGSGLNFTHYPPEVERVVAVEPEARMRELARQAAAEASVPVEVVDGVAEDLSSFAGQFDAAVCSLVLCSVPDQCAALAQLRSVLRRQEGSEVGEVRLLEHVRADGRKLAGVQRALDATVWPWIGAGCHCSRDLTKAIAPAGLAVKSAERFKFPPTGPTMPTSPHMLITAVPERRADPGRRG